METSQLPYIALQTSSYSESVRPLRCTFIGWRVATAVCGSFLFGYSLAVTNAALNSAAIEFEWCGNGWDATCFHSKLLSNAINALLYVGAVVGSMLSGKMVVNGRRKSLQMSLGLYALGSLVAILPWRPRYAATGLLLSRLISGVGTGVTTVVVPLFIAEMAAAEKRGYWGAFHQTGIGLGILSAAIISGPLRVNFGNENFELTDFDKFWWRTMLALPLGIALISLLSFKYICVEETPHYLVQQNNVADAVAVLRQSHGATTLLEIEPAFLEILHSVQLSALVERVQLGSALGKEHYRYALLVGFGLAAIHQLSGINVIVSLSIALFAAAGTSATTASRISVAVAAANAAASVGAGALVEKWGRRPLLMGGAIGVSVCLLLGFLTAALAGAPFLVALLICGAVVAYSSSLGPTVWIYLSEIYPLDLRPVAMASCGVINWVTASAIVFGGGFFDGAGSAALFFGLCSAAGAIFIAEYVIETQGTSIENSPLSPRCSSRLPDVNSPRNSSGTDICGPLSGEDDLCLSAVIVKDEHVPKISFNETKEDAILKKAELRYEPYPKPLRFTES